MAESARRPFCPADTPANWIRPRAFRIDHVDLRVSVDLDHQRVAGTVMHRLTWQVGGDRRIIELDQHDLEIASVDIDGTPCAFSCSLGHLLIEPPAACSTTCQLTIAFAAEHPAKGLFFIASDAVRQRVAMAWTQGAIEDHSHWFPCYDSPNNLSTFRISIRHRSTLVAAANGDLIGRQEHGDGWATTTYQQERPHVLYLLNMVVGDFVVVEDDSGPVPIANLLPRGREHAAGMMFRSTAFAMRWMGEWTGMPFPWTRYGHVVVHAFTWGGMENTTLTTIADRGIVDEQTATQEEVDIDALVIHELAHQWYGDLLTMKAWSDIWLNESFATYVEARCCAAWRASYRGTAVADELASKLWANRQDYLAEDGGRYRRPLVTNRYVDPYELFDCVAYQKGSLVLHALACHLGEERWRSAIALYTARHAHDLVETGDLRQAIEDATGEPLDWFFAQWVYRSGHPHFLVRWRHDPGRSQLIIEITQQQALEDPDLLFRVRLEIAWRVGDLQACQRVDLSRVRETVVLPCAQAPAWVVVDPQGEVPAEWKEETDTAQLISSMGDPGLAAAARARAAQAAGERPGVPRLISALAQVVRTPGTPDVVVEQALAALGRLRSPAGRQALDDLWPGLESPRLRRIAAKAYADPRAGGELARQLEQRALQDPSKLVAGELWVARASLDHPGATPLLRAQLKVESWNQRLRQALLRALGECGEPAALDEALAMLADDTQIDEVRAAALGACAQLGATHPQTSPRVRRALESHLDAPSPRVRSACAQALAKLGDPESQAALAARLGREPYGNVRRALRDSLERLGTIAAARSSDAAMTKQIGELEQGRRNLESRLEALEARLMEAAPASERAKPKVAGKFKRPRKKKTVRRPPH